MSTPDHTTTLSEADETPDHTIEVPEDDHSIVATDIFHSTDLFTEILSHLPVRYRWCLAMADRGTYRAYQARHTHQYRVEGCGVELYFAPHPGTIQTVNCEGARARTLTVRYNTHKTILNHQRKHMHKVDLIRDILRLPTRGISLLAPTSYGKTLMAATIAFQYRGGGGDDDSRPGVYRLGDEIRPQDRTWLIVPNKCIENQLAELEKAYPGCIRWDDPYHSPVIVMQHVPTGPDGTDRGKWMKGYAAHRIPNYITGQVEWRNGWQVTNERFLIKYRLNHLGAPLSPHNKVIVLGHGALRTCNNLRAYEDDDVRRQPTYEVVWPDMRSGLLLIDEAHMRSDSIQSLMGMPEARPDGHIITMSATKHLAPRTGQIVVTQYSVEAATIAAEKPLYTMRPQYYETHEEMDRSLVAAIVAGHKRIMYAIGASKQCTSQAYEGVRSLLLSGVSRSSAQIGYASGNNIATAIKWFNDGGHNVTKILVARAVDVTVGFNIHADYVLVAAHGRSVHAHCTEEGWAKVRREALHGQMTHRRGHADLMIVTALHQLIGRFVRIHNNNESIPITIGYHGPYRVGPDQLAIDELATRTLIAATNVRQTIGMRIGLTELNVRCLALCRVIPDLVLDMDEPTLLYHLYPTVSAPKRIDTKTIVGYSPALTAWLRKDLRPNLEWTYLASPIDADVAVNNTTPTILYERRPGHVMPYHYIEDPTASGGSRLCHTTGEEKRAVLEHVARLRTRYLRLRGLES